MNEPYNHDSLMNNLNEVLCVSIDWNSINFKIFLKLNNSTWLPMPSNGSEEIGEAENEKVYLKLRTVSGIHKEEKNWI